MQVEDLRLTAMPVPFHAHRNSSVPNRTRGLYPTAHVSHWLDSIAGQEHEEPCLKPLAERAYRFSTQAFGLLAAPEHRCICPLPSTPEGLGYGTIAC